jgi:hypothetical protein
MDKIVYYCSNCGAEVTIDQEVCPSCGLEIEGVESSAEDSFTTVVKSYDTLIDAKVAQDILKEEGIESYLSESNYNSAYPSSLFNEMIYLFVMEKDFEKAFEIVDGYENAKPE